VKLYDRTTLIIATIKSQKALELSGYKGYLFICNLNFNNRFSWSWPAFL